MATCIGIIAFTQWRALLFGSGVLAVSGVFYYVYRSMAAQAAHEKAARPLVTDRVLVPVANPRTAESLVHLASMVAQASEDTSICVLTIVPSSRLSKGIAARLAERLGTRQRALLSHLAAEVQRKNIPFYTKFRTASSIAEGILEEVRAHGSVKLIIMGWPGPLNGRSLAENPVKLVLQRAPTNIAVLLDRGLGVVRNILVPVGGGPHSRLAVRVAFEIAEQERAEVTAFRCLCGVSEIEEMEDQLLLLREIIEDELGNVPPHIATRIACADSVPKGILAETTRRPYDLVVMGASEEWALKTRLFGSIDDWIVERVQCSVLLVRAHEPAPISWIRRQTKRIERDNGEQIYQPTH
jgi:CIC family chloride channel protein